MTRPMAPLCATGREAAPPSSRLTRSRFGPSTPIAVFAANGADASGLTTRAGVCGDFASPESERRDEGSGGTTAG